MTRYRNTVSYYAKQAAAAALGAAAAQPCKPSIGERCRCLQWKSETTVADLVSVQTTVADLQTLAPAQSPTTFD